MLFLLLLLCSKPSNLYAEEAAQEFSARHAFKDSPFFTVSQKLQESLSTGKFKVLLGKYWPSLIRLDPLKCEELYLLRNWNGNSLKSERLTRCKLLVSALYMQDINWSNSKAFDTPYLQDDFIDTVTPSLVAERMRIYDYCFLKGDLSVVEVFSAEYFRKNNLTPWDYQLRMFPFINIEDLMRGKPLLPDIYDLRTSQKLQLPSHPLASSDILTSDFNVDFLANWAKLSSGQGIVTTMGQGSLSMFKRQLRVLQELNNTLPIEILTTGKELSQDYLIEMSKIVNSQNQKVYLVNLSPILNSTFSNQKISGYYHKFFAVLFNTFEDVLFIDVDAVPFKDLEYNFKNEEYRRAGIYLYRDRAVLQKNKPMCLDIYRAMEPSLQERALIGTKLMFQSSCMQSESNSAEGLVFHNIFRDNYYFHVDSGLIAVSKSRKFNGLLMSTLLNYLPQLSTCSHGDKEFFLLGQLFAGEKYAVHPLAGGITGQFVLLTDEARSTTIYSICATQLAHIDCGGELLWTNGGLRTCKFDNLATQDYEREEGFFSTFYKSAEELDKKYNSPISIEELIIPDRKLWFSTPGCMNYELCGQYVPSENVTTDFEGGKLYKFDASKSKFYKKISLLWNA